MAIVGGGRPRVRGRVQSSSNDDDPGRRFSGTATRLEREDGGGEGGTVVDERREDGVEKLDGKSSESHG